MVVADVKVYGWWRLGWMEGWLMHLRNVSIVRVSLVLWAVALIFFFRTRPQFSFESREKCGEHNCFILGRSAWHSPCPFLATICSATVETLGQGQGESVPSINLHRQCFVCSWPWTTPRTIHWCEAANKMNSYVVRRIDHTVAKDCVIVARSILHNTKPECKAFFWSQLA